MKILLVFLFVLLSFFSKAQVLEPACLSLMDSVYENQCILQDVDTIHVGNTRTTCFPFKPITPSIHFKYLIINGDCGITQPYNRIFLSIYNSTCDTLVFYDTIKAPNWDMWVILDPTQTYILCYKIKANCSIYSMCPIINPSPLPVQWLWYRALYSKEERRIYITWSTASEQNTAEFILEKFVNNSFKQIQRTPGNYYSTTISTYQIVDEVVLPGNYYRIKQIDFNGSFKYSEMFLVLVHSFESTCTYTDIFGREVKELKSGSYIKKCGNKFSKVITIQ